MQSVMLIVRGCTEQSVEIRVRRYDGNRTYYRILNPSVSTDAKFLTEAHFLQLHERLSHLSEILYPSFK